jgi:ABC-2 type transport system permease protein
VRLLTKQVRWEQKQFWRNPPAAVFTVAFPLIFLFIFSVVFSDERDTNLPGDPKFVQVFVPAIVAFGLISACYTSIAFTLTLRREDGVLKRKRGTPLPTGAYFGGMIGSAVIVSAILATITILVGVAVFAITFPDVGRRLPTLAVALLVGAFSFSALGIAMSTVIPNRESAPAIINVVLFPLLFISGTFARVTPGSAIDRVAQLFPVWHLNKACERVFREDVTGAAWRPWSLVALLAWGCAGTIVAVRRFRWEPRSAAPRPRRSRSQRSPSVAARSRRRV